MIAEPSLVVGRSSLAISGRQVRPCKASGRFLLAASYSSQQTLDSIRREGNRQEPARSSVTQITATRKLHRFLEFGRQIVHMRLVSLNVGIPRLLTWKGSTFKTGIFKQPAEGRIMLRQTNLDGDRQADLTVHGGIGKAVYVYPSEHYSYWRRELSRSSTERRGGRSCGPRCCA